MYPAFPWRRIRQWDDKDWEFIEDESEVAAADETQAEGGFPWTVGVRGRVPPWAGWAVLLKYQVCPAPNKYGGVWPHFNRANIFRFI